MYPAERKTDYFRVQNGPFSIRKQDISLMEAQLLLTSVIKQGQRRAWANSNYRPVASTNASTGSCSLPATQMQNYLA